MNARETIWIVARREMTERLRQKSFLASTGVTVLIVLLVATLPTLLGGDGLKTYTVAAADAAGAPVLAAAQRVAKQFDAKVEVKRFPDVAAARRAVADEDLDALLTPRSIESLQELDRDLLQILQGAARRVASERALSQEGVEGAAAVRALDPPPLAVRTQEEVDPNKDARSGFAFAAVLLLYGQLLTFCFWVASGVVEEKASRVVEVLLAAIRPLHLLAGKIVGLGILGFAQLLAIAAIGLGAAAAVGSIDLDGDLVFAAALTLVWFVLGYAFYSCAFACAGAIVPRQEELQSSMTPLTTVILVSFFVAFAVLQNPDGMLATVSSFIPTTAPMIMPPRIALGEAPAWQVIAAIAVTAASAAALVPLAARIYSGAILRTGSSVKLRDAWRSARA
ncbi:MAG: ABC transporter permease [Solirubrobacterales bacterium]|nr:ABC transporter permease [Solirubrobacterales bacterium]